MKKRNSGCCFLFVCLLFLLPGIFLLKDKLPDEETITAHKDNIQNRIEELFHKSSKPKELSDEERAEVLADGTAENGCSYYYWMLDEGLRVDYMTILNAFQSMEEDIDLLLDEDSMKQIVKMIHADHPEIFWVDQSYDYSLYDSWVQIHPRYTCSAEEKEVRVLQVEQTVEEGLSVLPENALAYEYIKALYTYVVDTVEYDLDASDNQNIYSSMVNRVSVCTGYAKELQYLLQRAGIQALLVEGEVEGRGPHAWLIAYCGGEYYHIDPTFGDPSYMEESLDNLESLPGELRVDYAYLCCDTESILRGRSISTELEVPYCESTALLYYPMHNLYFCEYDEEVLISLQESIDWGQQYWEGQFENEYAYEEMIAAMQDGTFANLILANNPDLESVRLNMSYRDDSLVVKMWY